MWPLIMIPTGCNPPWCIECSTMDGSFATDEEAVIRIRRGESIRVRVFRGATDPDTETVELWDWGSGTAAEPNTLEVADVAESIWTPDESRSSSDRVEVRRLAEMLGACNARFVGERRSVMETEPVCSGELHQGQTEQTYPAGDVGGASTFFLDGALYVVGGWVDRGGANVPPWRLPILEGELPEVQGEWEPVAAMPSWSVDGVGFRLGGFGFAGLGFYNGLERRDLHRTMLNPSMLEACSCGVLAACKGAADIDSNARTSLPWRINGSRPQDARFNPVVSGHLKHEAAGTDATAP